MRNIKYWIIGIALALVGSTMALAADATDGKVIKQIGIYDSRAVAYAHFWTDDHQRKLKEQMEAAKAAKTAGDKAQYEKLAGSLKDLQKKNHRQVFGAAPVEEAMTALQPQMADIQKEAGVSILVSKWDEQGLKQYKAAKQVDVTDLLVRKLIQPTEKQLKTIEEIKKQKPVPFDQITE